MPPKETDQDSTSEGINSDAPGAAAGSARAGPKPEEDYKESVPAETEKRQNRHHAVKKPQTLEAVMSHAVLGGLQTYVMAHSARGGLNFILRLLLVFRKRKETIGKAFTSGFFGKDAFRFGIAFGGFSFLWKLINNGMRHVRGKDDMLNGLIAGSVAGVSLMAEKRERRITIAQQLFVRALQALYNAGHAREYFNFPYGDSLLFMVTSAQVLYAYAVQPHSLPPEFLNFMVKTARVSKPSLALNSRLRTTNLPITVQEAQAIVKKYKGTKNAFDYVSRMPPRPATIPCALVHPHTDSCIYASVDLFYQVVKQILPVYAALNTVSMLVLRLKHFVKNPTGLIQKNLLNSVRSSTFLASFVSFYLVQICGHRNLIKAGLISWDHKYFYWVAGFVTSLSIFIEDRRRTTDLALYVLPKAAESWYKLMYERNWIFELHKSADVWFFSAAMGVIMAFYQHEPEVLSPIAKTILQKFIGKN